VKLYDPSLTRANLSALEISIAHTIKCYTNILFIHLFYLHGRNPPILNPSQVASSMLVIIIPTFNNTSPLVFSFIRSRYTGMHKCQTILYLVVLLTNYVFCTGIYDIYNSWSNKLMMVMILRLETLRGRRCGFAKPSQPPAATLLNTSHK